MRNYRAYEKFNFLCCEGLLIPYGSCKSSMFVYRYEKLFLLVEIQDYQHEGIGSSDAVNMVRSIMFFSKLCQDDRR